MSKVTDKHLLGKTKKKESRELQNSSTKMLPNLTLRSQTLGKMYEMFQNIYHVDLLYIICSSVGNSFCTP